MALLALSVGDAPQQAQATLFSVHVLTSSGINWVLGPDVEVSSGGHVTVTDGTLTFTTGYLEFKSPGTLNGAGALILGGGMRIEAGGVLNKSGAGALTIGGPSIFGPGATINSAGGSIVWNSDAGTPTSYNLNLNLSSTTATFNSSQHLHSLSMSNGATATLPATIGPYDTPLWTFGDRFLATQGLSMDSTSTLDLGNGTLLLDYSAALSSPLESLIDLVAASYDGGMWDLPGITSSVAEEDAFVSASTGLGIFDNSLGGFFWNGLDVGLLNASGLGEPIVPETVIVKYTFLGDSDLDGDVDDADYSNYLYGLSGGSPSLWQFGDFNYDHAVNGLDLDIFKWGYYISNGVEFVPEPSSYALMAISAAGLFALRKRGRRKTARVG